MPSSSNLFRSSMASSKQPSLRMAMMMREVTNDHSSDEHGFGDPS